MKRFTETKKWSDPWFRKLDPKFKALWLYLVDSCDVAGVWDADLELAAFHIGATFSEGEAEKVLGERITILKDGKWFIPTFVQFQYGELSADCRPHKPIIELIKKHGVERLLKGYQYPTNRVQDKEKDKDKEKLERECEGKQFPESIDTPEVHDAWRRWEKHRTEIKKKLTPEMTTASLKKLATFGPIRAVEIIEYTLEKGWQGLAYEETNYGNRKSSSGSTLHERRQSKADECRAEGIVIPVISTSAEQ